ncbi:unnamed protein product [Symbiodinium sp. CCMP2456]|nr:unnamed protein product [Symbiodinium sp. CCMP2456]
MLSAAQEWEVVAAEGDRYFLIGDSARRLADDNGPQGLSDGWLESQKWTFYNRSGRSTTVAPKGYARLWALQRHVRRVQALSRCLSAAGTGIFNWRTLEGSPCRCLQAMTRVLSKYGS